MMKSTATLVACAGFSLALSSGHAQNKEQLATEKDKYSYALGWNFGKSLKDNYVEVNLDELMKGMHDAVGGATAALTEPEVRQVLNKLRADINAKIQAIRTKEAQENLKKADAFLAENKSKPGVQTLPDGLQYKILTDGSGASPKSNDTVTVQYRGTLIDGTEFDSSYKRGQPMNLAVNMVIPGWSEALKMMKVRSKWQLFIPPNLAYGQWGRGRTIPPNSALIFDVELLKIAPKPPMPAAHPPITSDIIRVPSRAEIAKGAKVQVLTPQQVEELKKQEQQNKPK